MKKTVSLIVLLLGIGAAGFGQQERIFTQFFSNKLIVNPAYAGSRDGVSMVAFYRHQWAGFSGAPRTGSFSIHSPILNGNSGVGFSLIHEQLGIERNLVLNAAYAFRLQLGKGRLSMGINGQLHRLYMDWTSSNPGDASDPTIPYYNDDKYFPNFGTGFYYDSERWYAGVAIPKLLENQLKETSAAVTDKSNLSQLQRHFFVMGGAVFGLTESVKLKPAFLFKYVRNAPMQLDLNLSLLIRETFWVGTTFRTDDSIDLFFQYHLKNLLRFGYAYDFVYSGLSAYQGGTHELMFGIDLPNRKRGVGNPRYF